jgi:hypothetical protein
MKYAVTTYVKWPELSDQWYLSGYYEFRSNKTKKFQRWVQMASNLPKNTSVKIERLK